jgi:hypothetical protein
MISHVTGGKNLKMIKRGVVNQEMLQMLILFKQ